MGRGDLNIRVHHFDPYQLQNAMNTMLWMQCQVQCCECKMLRWPDWGQKFTGEQKPENN